MVQPSEKTYKHWRTEEDSLLANAEKVNILLVDDLPEKLLVYQTILADLNQNLITARSGEEALKQVLQHEFAVILLDVNMPGMDGFETASLIRQRRKSAHTPIIFLTAFTDDMRAQQGYASGAVDYLPLPVVPEVLQAKVRVFIELSQMRRQAASQAEEKARRTAAEESARRSAFLVRAGEVLARSQGQSEILRAMVRLPIPFLADVSIARTAGDDANAGRMEWAWRDDDENAGKTLNALPSLPWLEKAIKHVTKTAQLQFIPEVPQHSETDSNALVNIGSALVLPLIIRGQTRGVLVLARKRGEGAYQPNDVSLACDLTARAGIALENAMLMERIQDADRRKDEFLGMLAHELRNPLGPIRNAVQLMQMLGFKEERMTQLRDIIDRQVSHMARLIDDLLDATRMARGQILLRKERCDLTALTRQTAEDYRSIFNASGITLDIDLPNIPLWVEGDPTRLIQSIGNLLHNAHKFTNPEGTVTIKLTREQGSRFAQISVRDTGIGIDPGMLPYIFDVFRQAEQGLDRSRGGLGLGLTLVKGLIALHDGEVRAASNGVGQGTEITLSLPAESQTAKILPFSPSQPATQSKQKYRILLIEDNRDAAESAQQLLAMEGHEVHIVHSGPAGLDAAKTFRPQIILCDIGLPGMDGYQIARAIRQDASFANTYMIAMTGYGRAEDQRQAREAGFNLHLTKPIDHQNLQRCIGEISFTPA